ncbi:MAG: hypothetical protein LBU89_01040 [Fibromonadaceae bacterium]|jgi:hypothetical protein|nr:hypothetical protein [Fibromonadaceae bacterium]
MAYQALVPLVYVVGAGVATEYTIRGIDKLKDYNKEKKEAARRQNDLYMAELKTLEAKRLSMQFTEEYIRLNDKGRRAANQAAQDEIKALLRKAYFTREEITYAQSQGKIEALDKRAETHYLSPDTQKMLDKAKANVAYQDSLQEIAQTTTECAKIELEAIMAAIAGYNNKQEASLVAALSAMEAQKQAAELAQAQAKVFDEEMQKKADAMKNLADFDEKMRIASLDGEAQKQAQLLANYNIYSLLILVFLFSSLKERNHSLTEVDYKRR